MVSLYNFARISSQMHKLEIIMTRKMVSLQKHPKSLQKHPKVSKNTRKVSKNTRTFLPLKKMS